VYYRLTQDWQDLPEGSVISEVYFRRIFYLDKGNWEVIPDFEIKDMIKYEDENYCSQKGIEFLLFYTEKEQEIFLNKQVKNGVVS